MPTVYSFMNSKLRLSRTGVCAVRAGERAMFLVHNEDVPVQLELLCKLSAAHCAQMSLQLKLCLVARKKMRPQRRSSSKKGAADAAKQLLAAESIWAGMLPGSGVRQVFYALKRRNQSTKATLAWLPIGSRHDWSPRRFQRGLRSQR